MTPQKPAQHEPSRFEQLALDVGIPEDELRGLLRRLIAKKCGWATPRRTLLCGSCGVEFELSERRSRELAAKGQPRCLLCRHATSEPDMTWMQSLPADVLERAVTAMATLAA